MKKFAYSWLLLFSFTPPDTWAQDQGDKNVFSDGDEFADFYGGDEFISIATGYSKPINKAPAVASVITKQQINQSNAQDIRDVLEMVPGLHIEKHLQYNLDRFVIRGISSLYGPQTLLLINDIPISSLFTGNQNYMWSGMPVKSIERVEVIRGPGSAIYGADAFAGVINIITKNAQQNNANKMGVSVGSFNSRNGFIQLADATSELKYLLSIEYGKTDGENFLVKADSQTVLDNAVGINASLAPGNVNRSLDTTEVRFESNYHDLTFRAGFQGRYNIGTDFGIASALDPKGRYASERATLDLNYQGELLDNWQYQLKTSYFHGTRESEKDSYLFPEGGFTGQFPDGMIGNPEYKEQNLQASGTLSYKGSQHYVRMGLGLFDGGIYEVKETKNFDSNFQPLPGGVIDVSDTNAVYLPESRRDNQFIYLQDEWQVAPDWELTLGARYDKYSDFGSTLNPRVALVWSADYNLSVKALYGRAFRAPSFAELYAINNPVAQGNPDLKPEVINTYELAFNYSPTPDLKIGLNIFSYQLEDSIHFVPDTGGNTATVQNAGEQSGHGLEFETKYNVSKNWDINANYAYQYSKMKVDIGNGKRFSSVPGHAPNHSLYLSSNNQISDLLQFSLQWNYIGKRERLANDLRGDLAGYHKVDATLNISQLLTNMDCSVSIKNLLNDEIKEPSPGPAQGSTSVKLPDDLPQYERSIWFNVKYNF